MNSIFDDLPDVGPDSDVAARYEQQSPRPPSSEPWDGILPNIGPYSGPNPWDELLGDFWNTQPSGRCWGGQIERPAFQAVAPITQQCFIRVRNGLEPFVPYDSFGRASPVMGLQDGDWPRTQCRSPCLEPGPAVLPTRAQIQTALHTTPLLLPPDSWLRDKTEPLSSNPSAAPIVLTRQLASAMGELDGYALLANAVALLYLNRDLVDWVACLTEDNRALDPRFAEVPDLRQCMERAMTGQHVVYVISRFTRGVARPLFSGTAAPLGVHQSHLLRPWADTAPAMGGASGQFKGGTDGFTTGEDLEGAVIPVHHPAWYNRAVAFRDRDIDAFAAAVGTGAVILHEWMHRCIDKRPGIEDAYQCFAIHSMLARSYQWAMGQRYPDLQQSCLAVGDERFMLGLQPAQTSSLYEGPDFRRAC